jgi:hypothetical protein
MDRDPVVRPDRVGVEPERLANAGRERQRPGRVHPGAERRQDAEPPVADLVSKTLDDDRAIRRHGSGRAFLLPQERQQVRSGPFVERVVVPQPRRRLLVGKRD